MSNTWPGCAFPPLVRKASGLIRRPQCGCGGSLLNATVGVCDDHSISVASLKSTVESKKILGSMLLFMEIMHMYYMSLCFNLSLHSSLSPFHFSLSLSRSPFSIQHLLQLCKGPHLKQPGVTFNLEVLWLGSGSLHRPPNRLHPSVTVKPLLVLLSSKSNSELLHMQKPCCSDLTVTCSRMAANRGETLPMTSL